MTFKKLIYRIADIHTLKDLYCVQALIEESLQAEKLNYREYLLLAALATKIRREDADEPIRL